MGDMATHAERERNRISGEAKRRCAKCLNSFLPETVNDFYCPKCLREER